jgi:hypothetical protein
VDPNANIIFGALVDESMEGEIAITVIATGFPLGKAEAEEKLAQMHQQAQASGKSVRTISDAMRAAEAKQSSLSSQSAQQAQPQPAHRRVATHAKKAETAPEESAEDASPRSRQRIGASESLEKASEPTTHTHTPSHAQVSAAACGVRRLGETTSPTAAGPVLTTVVCCVSQKSSRIVSTEDADLPDFLSRLRRNR